MPPMPYARIGARFMFAAISMVRLISFAIVMLMGARVYLKYFVPSAYVFSV